jgi:hypothetical protein
LVRVRKIAALKWQIKIRPRKTIKVGAVWARLCIRRMAAIRGTRSRLRGMAIGATLNRLRHRLRTYRRNSPLRPELS